MRNSILTGLLLLSLSVLSHAQTAVVAQNNNAFQGSQGTKAFSFRLPQNAYVHDMIYVTKENGIMIKKFEITKDILASRDFSFATDDIPTGSYIVTVASNGMIKYKLKFNSKGHGAAVILKDSKQVAKADPVTIAIPKAEVPIMSTVTETVALSFNSKLKEFTVSSGIPFREGTKIEVFNAQHTLLASKDVTAEMIKAKKYSIKVDPLYPGSYFVNVDDVIFGGITYTD